MLVSGFSMLVTRIQNPASSIKKAKYFPHDFMSAQLSSRQGEALPKLNRQ